MNEWVSIDKVIGLVLLRQILNLVAMEKSDISTVIWDYGFTPDNCRGLKRRLTLVD